MKSYFFVCTLKFSILFLFFSALINAQSEFVEKGNYGAAAAYAWSTNDIFSVTGFNGGISFYGVADLGIQYGKTSSDKTTITSSSTLVYGAYSLKRPNSKTFVKFSLGYFSGTTSAFENVTLTGPVLGLDVFFKVYENESVVIMPSLGLAFGLIKISGNSFNSSSEDIRTLSGGFSFQVKAGKNFSLIFSPAFSKNLLESENSFSYGINAGIVICGNSPGN